jgi:lipoate-protein ligase A
MNWLWLDTGPGAPAWNMAFDEALLEFARTFQAPILRLYSWTEPAATFGYFQHYADIAAWTDLRPLIRRPTGGGLVPHDADWTYSVIFPPHDPWYQLRATESYKEIHALLARAFQSIGVQAELAATAQKEAPGQCFIGAEQHDLLLQGRKIAGAAQRRTRDGLLIQGSIQPKNIFIAREQFHRALLAPDWQNWSPAETFLAHVTHLVSTKYSQLGYNQKR